MKVTYTYEISPDSYRGFADFQEGRENFEEVVVKCTCKLL
jgi:hypothetical protein